MPPTIASYLPAWSPGTRPSNGCCWNSAAMPSLAAIATTRSWSRPVKSSVLPSSTKSMNGGYGALVATVTDSASATSAGSRSESSSSGLTLPTSAISTGSPAVGAGVSPEEASPPQAVSPVARAARAAPATRLFNVGRDRERDAYISGNLSGAAASPCERGHPIRNGRYKIRPDLGRPERKIRNRSQQSVPPRRLLEAGHPPLGVVAGGRQHPRDQHLDH